ncbi:MAG: nucleoside deaminase [Weeksellaceae bacterium]|nr:nucleoside deaminase [Weeksellaceae bacterium]
MENQHKAFMQKCIELARISKNRGESPVGSVVVKDGKIIGEGIESVHARNDFSFHAEIEAIRDASQHIGHCDLSGCTLFTTHEPCIMCSYIIRQTRIGRVVFGLSTGDIGGYHSELAVLKDKSVKKWNQPPEVIAGFMQEECKV